MRTRTREISWPSAKGTAFAGTITATAGIERYTEAAYADGWNVDVAKMRVIDTVTITIQVNGRTITHTGNLYETHHPAYRAQGAIAVLGGAIAIGSIDILRMIRDAVADAQADAQQDPEYAAWAVDQAARDTERRAYEDNYRTLNTAMCAGEPMCAGD